MPIFPYISGYRNMPWARQGVVLNGGGADETNNVYEPTVIREAGAVILTGTVFKMWYTQGWASPSINYAESTDGVSWTKYGSNPILAAHNRSSVFKDGTTYYMLTANTANTQIDLYSSTDGVAFSSVQAAAIGLGAGGQWDDNAIANTFVWKEGAGDYRMLYEANASAGAAWKIGYATSANLTSWSKSGSNPVITETGAVGGPFVYKAVSGAYWAWVHHAPSGILPTNLERYTSANLTAWTKNPAGYDTLHRAATDEGATSALGQTADPCLLEVNGVTYLYYAGATDGTAATGHQQIKLATARMTLEQLITTSEGP